MKYLTLTSLILVLLISACQKDSNPASMKATIDGTSWSSVTRVTKHIASTKMFTIVGTSASGDVIDITIRGDEVGNYSSSTSIDSASAQVGGIYKPDASAATTDFFVSTSGSVSITEIDESEQTISGTFSFTMSKLTETKSITNGEFKNLKYSGD